MLIIFDHQNSLINAIEHISCFEIYENGNIKSIKKENDKFEKLTNNIEELFNISRLEPAFGVSLDDETKKALNEDSWLKIKFDKQMIVNDLPFESLLIKLEDNVFGTNLIRENNKDYFGRCIYLLFEEAKNLKAIFC